MHERFEEVRGTLEGSAEDMVTMQRELCARPAVGPGNGGPGEAERAAWLTGQLETWGFPTPQGYPAPCPDVPEGTRPNLVYRIPGTDRTRTVWVLTHLDVVPPGEASLWTGDPWVVRIEGDRLIARGVEDNQQGLVSSVFAARALLDAGITPACDVALAFVSDEETGSRYGAEFLVTEHRDLFGDQDLLLIPDAGNEDGTMIEVAEKSILWIEFKVKGRQTHGSTPDLGVNAHRAGAHLIVRLESLREAFDATDPLFDPPRSTFEPTLKRANVSNINTIPGEDRFAFDCRVLPVYTLEAVMEQVAACAKEIEAAFGVTVDIETAQYAPAAPPTPPDAPIVEALRAGIRAVYGVEGVPMGIGGGTVAAFFRRAGLPAAVWSRMDDQAHQPDEYCLISNMVGDAAVMAHLFLSAEA